MKVVEKQFHGILFHDFIYAQAFLNRQIPLFPRPLHERAFFIISHVKVNGSRR